MSLSNPSSSKGHCLRLFISPALSSITRRLAALSDSSESIALGVTERVQELGRIESEQQRERGNGRESDRKFSSLPKAPM